MRGTASLVSLGVVALLAACSGPTATESAGPEKPKASTTTEAEPSIRDIDFTSVDWVASIADEPLTLAQGNRSTSDSEWAVEANDIVYGDVDGDGAEDAVVPISQEPGNGLTRQFFIWTWDPEEADARQVPHPVAEEQRCGSSVNAVTVEGGFVRIDESIRRASDPGPCAEPAEPVVRERVVQVNEGWPIMSEPTVGYGGLCPEPGQGDASLFPIADLAGVDVFPAAVDGLNAIDVANYMGFEAIQPMPGTDDKWLPIHLAPGDGAITTCAFIVPQR